VAQCAAKCKATGEQCRRRAVKGSRVCQVHGGVTPTGADAHQFVHGRYSKALPKRLAERYEASLSDPDLLNLRQEVSIVDARIEDVLKRVDSGESEKLWKALADEVRDVEQNAALTGTYDLRGLKKLIARGVHDWMAWNEVIVLIENRRKLVASEGKRLVAMQQMVTAGQAMGLVTALMESVNRNVDNDTARAAIGSDFARLIGRDDLLRIYPNAERSGEG
jgi:hypothetical protein